MADRHLVLWDGECAFCGRAISSLEKRDLTGRMEFIAYQQAPTPPMTDELREACERSVHVVRTDGSILRGGRAALFVLDQLGWRRTAGLLGYPPAIWLVELAYAIVARNRHFFGRFLFRSEPV